LPLQSNRSRKNDLNSGENSLKDLSDTGYCTPRPDEEEGEGEGLDSDTQGRRERESPLSEGSKLLKKQLLCDTKALSGLYADTTIDLNPPCDDEDIHTPKETPVDSFTRSPFDYIPENSELGAHSEEQLSCKNI
jgi:hypothetical protein